MINISAEVVIKDAWAGHFNDCSDGHDHDKVVAYAYDNQKRFYAVWGRRGAKLSHQEKDGVGYIQFMKKMQEKLGEGYKSIPFDDKYYKVPSFDPNFKPSPKVTYFSLMQPTIADDRRFQMLASNEGWGMTERVTGDRRLLIRRGNLAQVYSVQGTKATLIEDGIMPFNALGCDYVLEGIHTADRRFIVTDMREFNGWPVPDLDYRTRMKILEAAMLDAKLITRAGPFADPTAPISLLTPAPSGDDWQTTVEQARKQGGSGIVLHAMDAGYVEGVSPFVQELVF